MDETSAPQAGAALIGGYLELLRPWKSGDCVELALDTRPTLLGADPRIPELTDKVAVQRGPLVYCAEELDNGSGLHALSIDPSIPLEEERAPDLPRGCVSVVAQGYRDLARAGERGRAPYFPAVSGASARERARIVLVPYHVWGNRRPGQEMRIWLRAREGSDA